MLKKYIRKFIKKCIHIYVTKRKYYQQIHTNMRKYKSIMIHLSSHLLVAVIKPGRSLLRTSPLFYLTVNIIPLYV